jgi:phage host-nuclease inhibitor protein Gam
MDCENCQELLSEYLDGELNFEQCTTLETHFEECAECFALCQDFRSIFAACEDRAKIEDCPPNPNAMWLRISNLIESEEQEKTHQEAEIAAAGKPSKISVLTAWMRKTWRFSAPQLATSVLGVALVASLLTVIGIKNFSRTPEDVNSATETNLSNASVQQPSIVEKLLTDVGFSESSLQSERERRLRQQQIAIDYWNQRVEARKNQWNKQMREAFDRNLAEINQLVADYSEQLSNNPDDTITEEMLNSTLNEKMELLREFSEL